MATLNEDLTPLMEFVRILVPRAPTLAALYNPANPFLPRMRSGSAARGFSLIELSFGPPAHWGGTLSTLMATRHPDALQVVADAFL
jgi:hypothetical protein